jgi:hypothetical protein
MGKSKSDDIKGRYDSYPKWQRDNIIRATKDGPFKAHAKEAAKANKRGR